MFLSKRQVVGFREIHALAEFQPDMMGLPSIHEGLGQVKVDERIMNYLSSGHNLSSYRGIEQDFFDGDEIVPGAFSMYTDGEWAWYTYVKYYYNKYEVKLPPQFIQHIRRNNFSVPKITSSELMEQLLNDAIMLDSSSGYF